MIKNVVILGACTNQKRLPPSPETRFDSLPPGLAEELVPVWIRRLTDSGQPRVACKDLYVGSAWNETIACVNSAQRVAPDSSLWVLSAGWGLIPSDAQITSYSATFATGTDSIHNAQWAPGKSAGERNQAWWRAINSGLKDAPPKSIADFAHLYPDPDQVIFLLILSPAYFQAIEPELNELVHCGYQVAIFSAGVYADFAGRPSLLKENIMPINDKFKQVNQYLNHTNVSLNSRVTNWAIQQFPNELMQGTAALHARLLEKEQSLPEMERNPVVPMTDEQVLLFIAKQYVPGSSSASQLLKVLRHEEKKSCERKRFANLFKKYEEENKSQGSFDL
jgi:hypothetical protein